MFTEFNAIKTSFKIFLSVAFLSLAQHFSDSQYFDVSLDSEVFVLTVLRFKVFICHTHLHDNCKEVVPPNNALQYV